VCSSDLRRDAVRERLGVNDATVFLLVANLVPFKGIPTLIQAAARMPGDARFACVIAGPEEPRHKIGGTIEYFMGLARAAGVAERIKFVGALPPDELAELYAAADAVVLPTHKDCFPKVLVEGALAGKPLVTTSACGAMDAVVINGDNGFVIEPGDADALAAAMTRLLDAELRGRMGHRSLELVGAFCSLEAETGGFAAAIRHALGNRTSERTHTANAADPRHH
jgi:glycosyltransferase involved in cell wall biosynthesis